MKAIKTLFFGFVASVVALTLFVNCKPSSASGDGGNDRGKPVLYADTPEYDENTKSFSLTLHADSIADAEVTYYLLDGDSLLMQNNDGHFTGIAPLEEGYNVKAAVAWNDTTYVTPIIHVVGFVVPREPVEKLSVEEVTRLINQKDKETMEKHLAQGITLTVVESERKPALLNEVYLYLDSKIWKSVEVKDVKCDDNNLITSITLKPIGEQKEAVADQEDASDFYDEE